MHQNSPFSNQKGFSLIEVMVVAGIMGFIAMGTASMVAGQVKDQKRILQKAELTDLKSQLSLYLGNRANCSGLVGGRTFNNASASAANPESITGIPQINLGAGNPAVTANDLLPGTQTALRATSISIGSIVPTGAANVYSAELQVGIDANSTVSAFKPVAVRMMLYANPAAPNTLTSCGGTEMTPDAICSSMTTAGGGQAQYDPTTGTCTVKAQTPADNCATTLNSEGVAGTYDTGSGICRFPATSQKQACEKMLNSENVAGTYDAGSGQCRFPATSQQQSCENIVTSAGRASYVNGACQVQIPAPQPQITSPQITQVINNPAPAPTENQGNLPCNGAPMPSGGICHPEYSDVNLCAGGNPGTYVCGATGWVCVNANCPAYATGNNNGPGGDDGGGDDGGN